MSGTAFTAMSESILKGASEKATLDAITNSNEVVIKLDPKDGKKAK